MYVHVCVCIACMSRGVCVHVYEGMYNTYHGFKKIELPEGSVVPSITYDSGDGCSSPRTIKALLL
jgi:hypothetical protein